MDHMSLQKLAYTLEEAAEQSGFTVSTLRSQVATGKLSARKAGTESAIRHADLSAWLDTLPTIPAGGHTFGATLIGEVAPGSNAAQDPAPLKPTFRTPEEVAPGLGVSKSALRQFARQTGFHTRVGKRIKLHDEDVAQLVAWMRERQDKKDDWWTEPEKDHFA